MEISFKESNLRNNVGNEEYLKNNPSYKNMILFLKVVHSHTSILIDNGLSALSPEESDRLLKEAAMLGPFFEVGYSPNWFRGD